MNPFFIRYDDVSDRYLAKLDRIVECISPEREIYCFGYSSVNIMAIGHLSEKYPDRKVCGFVDNNSALYSLGERDGRNEFKISPVSVLSGKADSAAVLISSMHYEGMAGQLRNMGFKDGEGIFQVTDLSDEHSDCFVADRSGYEEITLRDVKLLELDMLRYLKGVCEKNDIRYYLAYGTLLGAVRDQGIIPWDDDIDIYVWGEDFERLSEIVNREGRYQFLYWGNCSDFATDPGWMINPRFIEDRNMFPAVYTTGVCFDVFPLWSQPDDEKKKDFIESVKLLDQGGFEALGRKKGLHEAIERKVRYLSGFPDGSENVGCMHWGYDGELLKREWFNDSVNVLLEGEMFSVPSGFEEYLVHRFGSGYMAPPDIGKEKPRHRSKYYVNKDADVLGDGKWLEHDRRMLATARLRYEDRSGDGTSDGAEDGVRAGAGAVVGAEVGARAGGEAAEGADVADGAHKKTILFDTGIGAVLHYGAEMLNKLEDCMSVFTENKEGITVLWHTRGYSEDVISDAAIRQRYHDIVQRFISSDMGIYNDSADYVEAVKKCDAYYGDGGAVAQMVKEAGKPVMIMNVGVLNK